MVYGITYSGDPDAWRGFAWMDLHGDSMAGMVMPPHRIQTLAVTAKLGLPVGLTLATTAPFLDVHHVRTSEMPGDIDERALSDVDATVGWGRTVRDGDVFTGADLGLTFPTGEVRPRSPVRSGRGTFGVTGQVQAGWKLGPKWGLAGSLSGASGLGLDPTGYWVGRTASGALGMRWSPREGGRWNASAFSLLRWQGKDMQDALVYENTGYLSHDLALGASWNVWTHHPRSATLTARVTAPLWQVVGDPMYGENVSAGLGASVVAF